ncbi:hypothetical protein ACMHYB_47620 [Sorangium sp. So ce1128]
MTRSRHQIDPKKQFEFVRHTFKGPRFANGTMDVDVLRELSAYKAVVVAVAKHLFFSENGHRIRMPSGMERSFDLAIQATRHSSFDATLVHSVHVAPLAAAMMQGSPKDVEILTRTFFTRARDVVSDAINAAASGEHVRLPDHVLRAFNDFGKGLLDDEYISISRPGAQDGVRYNREIRTRILRATKQNFEDQIAVSGKIFAANLKKKTFQIRLDSGETIDGKFSLENKSKIAKAFDPHDATMVKIEGTGEFTPDGELRKILAIDDLIVVRGPRGVDINMLQIDSQTENLLLPQDLGDAGTVTLDPDGVAWLNDILHNLTDEAQVPLPYLYATPDAEVSAEWTFGPWEVIATFSLESRSAALLAVNTTTGKSADDEVADAGSPDATVAIVRFVTGFAASEAS